MMNITEAIREVDAHHIIVIEGNCWGNNYSGIFPLWDNNTVISFHKYWNYNDISSIQRFLDIREQYNVPLWLGESGENSNVWFRDAIRLVEKNHIGWAWWPLKKLGFNNPLEAQVPTGYQKILDYWAGKAPQPSAEEATDAVMELANNLKLENCIWHRDVIDAMFRQVRSNEPIAFNQNRLAASLTVNAVDYDLGRNGFAYFDNDTANYYISTGGPRTAGNKGHVYRNDGVDIGGDADSGYFINSIEKGEWLQYTIEADTKGKYTLSVLVSVTTPGGKVAAEANGTRSREIALPASNENWKPIHVATIKLVKGKNTIRIHAIDGGFNLKSVEIKKAGTK
jgi:endoglucanase